MSWHCVVGISGWYFCNVRIGVNSLLKILQEFLLNKSARYPKWGLSAQKGGLSPPFGGVKGLLSNLWYQNIPTKFPLVVVGAIPAKYQQIPTNNTKLVCNSKKNGEKILRSATHACRISGNLGQPNPNVVGVTPTIGHNYFVNRKRTTVGRGLTTY